MSRYHGSIDYLMDMDDVYGVDIVIKCIEKTNEEKAFEMYLHSSIRYEKSFNDYYASLKPYRKSTEEEKQEIIEKFGGY